MSPDPIRSAPSGRARPGTGPGLPSGRAWPDPRPGLLVLGPLVLRGTCGPVKLGGVKPRRLLAALALNAGRVLSADWLIDIAWGEWPPRTARQNLHTYLWSLRRSPAAAAGPRLAILERPPGYLLRADELGVDPSPGLNRLYVAMLRADAALDWPGPVPGALPPGPPGALTRPSRS